MTGTTTTNDKSQSESAIVERCEKCKLSKKPSLAKINIETKMGRQDLSPEQLNSKSNNYEQTNLAKINLTYSLQNNKHSSNDLEKHKSNCEELNLKSEKSFQDDEDNSKLNRLARIIPCLGILFSLSASLTLGSAGMLVKMTKSVHGVQVAFLRALIQLIVYGSIIYARNLKWMPEKGERVAVAGRAILGGASITFSYYALKIIPLADATTIRFSLPIWTLIISYLFLGESCGLLKIFAVVGSISGVIFIAKPEYCEQLVATIYEYLHGKSNITESLNESKEIVTIIDDNILIPITDKSRQLEGSLLALSSSICLAMSLVALRLCQKTRAETTIVWLSVFSALFGLIFLLTSNEFRLPNNLKDICFICLNGLLGALGQWFITCALKIEQSGIISLARTFDIVVAFSYGAILLGEECTIYSIIGAILVSAGVVSVVLPKWLCNKQEKHQKK